MSSSAEAGAGRVLITVDVEDHTVPPARPRFAEAIGPLLERLAADRARATFFVVGELVPTWRAELRALADAGHEIGLHGYTHRFLRDLGPVALADELHRGAGVLGDLLGASPAGFRAPYFSLTADTRWAPEVIAAAGFTYSSSVLPAWNPQAGYPGAPRRPFRWASGLVELPVPVTGIGRVAVPVLGGAYLRLAPWPVVRRAARECSIERGDWTYSHPYDFDAGEPFFRRPGQPWVVAKLLFARRGLMIDRVAALASGADRTMGDVASALVEGGELDVFPSGAHAAA